MDVLKIREELAKDQTVLLDKDYNHNVTVVEFRAEGLTDTIDYVFQFLLGIGFSEESIKKYLTRG